MQNTHLPHGAIVRFLRWIVPNFFDPPVGSHPWSDLNGALAGSLASIPQTLAYGLIIGGALGASLSGVGVLAALYGSVVVGLAAVIFGGCPLLVAGPRASALLVFAALIAHLSQAAALSHLADPAVAALALACLAVLGAGALQWLFGALRLGKLADYIPVPVVAGFINGSALLIIFSQVWSATGIAPQKSVLALLDHAAEIKPATLLLSLATAAAVMLLPRLTKRWPPVLLAFVIGVAVYHLLAFFGFGPALGGTLPPPPEHFALEFSGDVAMALLFGPDGGELVRPLLMAAASMAVLSTLDTLLATAASDTLTMRRSDAGRQLMAEGFGNALAGAFGMAPGSGSLARTQAALRGGMKSAAAPLGIALITWVVTLALAPLIGLLPRAVMAGLLLALGIDLIDKWTLARLRRLLAHGKGAMATANELLVVAVVVATALLADLATAVGIGVLLALLAFVMQMARSPVRRSYRATALLPRIYGDRERRSFVECHGRNIAVIEVEGALFFGTASALEARVQTLMDEGAVHVVLDLRRVKHIDATGARTLERINNRLAARGGMLAVSHVYRERRQRREGYSGESNRRQSKSLPRNTWTKLACLGTIDALGEERFLNDTDSAVSLCEKHLAQRLPDDAWTDPLSALDASLTRSLDRGMRRRLRGYYRRMDYAAGDEVFAQGALPNGVFFVASGRVDVLIDLPGTDRKLKVQSLTAGSVFGEMALIDPKPRSAAIVAAEASICYWMSAANFELLKREQADIAVAVVTDVAMIFAERLRATNTMLAEMEA